MQFNDFQFSPAISEAIQKCGYQSPTPIQQQAILPILKGKDILGLAQTGTGKTAAFVLPTVQRMLASRQNHVRTLILAPTRELAEQINDFARTITEKTPLKTIAIYGGVSKNGQINKIKNGVDIVVACPGRLLDIIGDKAIDLSRIEHLILDEADHMFDQGFLPDIRRILKQLPRKRQSLVFSATMPKEIRHLAEDVLYQPVTIQIDRIKPTSTVAHTLYSIEKQRKTDLLLHLLQESNLTTTLVFTRTKHRAKSLANKLVKAGYPATSLQGNLSQNRRQQALDGFKDGSFKILVATDIAARGIDVTAISHVINFDVPDTAEAYIHRTGRTGRASCTGEAFTFVTHADHGIIRTIERSMNKTLERQAVDLPKAAHSRETPRPERKSHGRVQEHRKGGAGPKHRRRGRSSSASAGIFGVATCTK